MPAADCSFKLPSCSLSLPRTCAVPLVVSLFTQKPPGFSTGSATSDQVHRIEQSCSWQAELPTDQLRTLITQFCGREEGLGVFTFIVLASIYPEAPWLAVIIYWEGVWVIMCLQNQRIQWTHPDNSQGIRHWFSSWTTELKTSLPNNLVNNFYIFINPLSQWARGRWLKSWWASQQWSILLTLQLTV